MRRLGIFMAVISTGCFRNLDFAPCQEDPAQPICFDTGTTDSATIDSESSDTNATVDGGSESEADSEAGTCTGPTTQSCGKCGTQSRTCTAGVWSDWTTCTGEKECMPGDVAAGGACSGALEKSTKTCNASCTYDADVCALPHGWTKIADPPTGLSGRFLHSCIWTGGEMIVYGGGQSVDGEPGKRDGAIFSLKKNAWELLPAVTLVAYGRKFHTAVWTGLDMYVWGGNDNGAVLNDGLDYYSYFKTWSKLPASPLAARQAHAAVWVPTTKRMLVWGGRNASSTYYADGAEYDQATSTWTMLPVAPIAARQLHHMIWTGTEVLVWGGENATGLLKDGALYNPTTKTWRALPSAPVSGRRWSGTGLTASTQFATFGGTDLMGKPIMDGAVVTVDASPRWKALTAPPATTLEPRVLSTDWVLGDSLTIWSGAVLDPVTGDGTLDTKGATLDIATGKWTAIPTTGAPAPGSSVQP